MGAKLPQELQWQDADNKWGAILDPVVANPIINGLQLQNISLINGLNEVNHKLGRKLQGWIITSINGIAMIYDAQASNQRPDLTLSLVSDNDVTISLWVY